MTVEDLYPTFVAEHGVIDPDDNAKAEPVDIFTYDGPWSRPNDRVLVSRWIDKYLPKNMVKRERQTRQRALELFEPAIANTMTEKDVLRYAGHSVPIAPNAPRRQIAARVFRNKMKAERDPNRRRMLAALQRKASRAQEYKLASRDWTWTPQR
jgi:pseudouridylate synthase